MVGADSLTLGPRLAIQEVHIRPFDRSATMYVADSDAVGQCQARKSRDKA